MFQGPVGSKILEIYFVCLLENLSTYRDPIWEQLNNDKTDIPMLKNYFQKLFSENCFCFENETRFISLFTVHFVYVMSTRLYTSEYQFNNKKDVNIVGLSIYLSIFICFITNHTAQQREKTVEQDRQG